jgi:hypothetical protein
VPNVPTQVLGKHPKPHSVDQNRKKRAVLTNDNVVTNAGVTKIPHRKDASIPKASAIQPVPTVPAFEMPKGGTKLGQLPSVIFSMRNRYFSTLYNALFASQQPFEHFKKNSALFLAVSRKAFKRVWPDLDVKLEADDTLFNIVGSSIDFLIFYLKSFHHNRVTNVFLRNEVRFTTLSRTNSRNILPPRSGPQPRLPNGLSGFVVHMEALSFT